jgi:hypothetical protein
MRKVKNFELEGRLREEKENCFPCGKTGENIKNKGAGLR